MVENHPTRAAIIYMLISTAAVSLMNICVRLAAETLHATLIVTLRNMLTIALLLPFALRNKCAVMRTTRLMHHVWRSAIGAVGMITWTYCLTLMPLTHATALSFTAPLLATLFAMLVLKEKASARHFLALGVGFLGTLIILRPGADGFDLNSLLVIFATASWAIVSVFIKSLSRTETPLTMIFYMNLFMFLIALPMGFMHWQWPDAATWLVVLGICLCSILMHFTMVRAYSLAPVVTLMPLDFMRLVFTSIFAYFIFNETSDHASWLGAAIIIASVVFIAPRSNKPVVVS
jgi:drug/metabolite transporter (DMT)-like permease